MNDILQSKSLTEYSLKKFELTNTKGTKLISTGNSAFELCKKLGKDNIYT